MMTMLTSGMCDIRSNTFLVSWGMKAKAGVAANGDKVPGKEKMKVLDKLKEVKAVGMGAMV